MTDQMTVYKNYVPGMEEDNSDYFQTSDLALSSYLKMKNVDLREIFLVEDGGKYSRCAFVFRILKTDPFLIRLLDDWENDRNCKEMKRLLFANQLMKKNVKDYMNSIRK